MNLSCPKSGGTLKSARRAFQDIKALGVIQAYDVQHRAWKQGTARDQLDEPKLKETLRAITDKGAELSTSELVRTTTLMICSNLASVVMALLDIIPELAADLRHMPGGFPAWTPNGMIDLLVDTSANTVDLQEELFLGPIPRGGWPTTRSSPLCTGLQRHGSHGSHGSHGAEQLKEPTVRSVRKDAAGLPTWLGATPRQMLEAIEQSGRPVYHSYVAIRNAAQFDIENNCEQSVELIFDPGQCFQTHAGVVYYVNNDPEVNDKLYVRWIGGAWSNRQSKEKPVWQASLEPILGPPEPYDMISMNFVAGNCRVLWKVLEVEKIALASLVYVPINPVIPPPIEVEPNYTVAFLWNRRKIKAAQRANLSDAVSKAHTLRRHVAAQCSLQRVVNLLHPLGYELLHLEHLYAVFAHENAAPLLRELQLAGPKLSTFEVWRQGWHCSPFSRHFLGLETLLGFDHTWLSPDGKGEGEKGLGCVRSFRDFLRREGHLISGMFTGKESCDEEQLESSEFSKRKALQRRLSVVHATTGASRGLASAEVMARKWSRVAFPKASSMWCQYQLSSHCVCLPPFRGSRCDIIDQSKDDEARKFRAGFIFVMENGGTEEVEELAARLKDLWRFNSQPGRGYPVLIFHPSLSEDAREQLAVASDNRIWLIKISEAEKGVSSSAAMRWFRFTGIFSHPALKGLEIFWDVSTDNVTDREDAMHALHRARLAPAACRKALKTTSYTRGRLQDVTELFLLHHGKEWKEFEAAGGVNLLTGEPDSRYNCFIWRRSFLSDSPIFTRYVRFLLESSGGIGELPYDLSAVRNLGTTVTSFLVKGGTRALMLT